jgi:murein DD-endopeptidase MepM/ murein hydrolase activator NlpD
MKKIIKIVLIISIITINLVPINQVNAKTLKEYKNELTKLETQVAENKRITASKKASIDSKRNAIIEANNTIAENETAVEEAKIKVAESEEAIKLKTKDMENVIDMLQYTNNNTNGIYYEYLLGASTITDLMERQGVVEQIANYTQEELISLEKLIDENTTLQTTLKEENETLTSSISTYEQEVRELEKYIDSLASIGLDKEAEIKDYKDNIKLFEKAGCRDNDDLQACYYNKNESYSTYFSRPLVSGKVTQAWGNNGHKGIDLGGNKKGTAIYAPANETVAIVAYQQSCGGNEIYMHHNVGGQAYTTEFAHLTSIYVKKGQKVNKGDIIGTVGGDSSTFWYDSCTSGTHLHYSVAYGYYRGSGTNGYSSWSTFTYNTRATNVQNISNFKNTRGWTWSSRG